MFEVVLYLLELTLKFTGVLSLILQVSNRCLSCLSFFVKAAKNKGCIGLSLIHL